MNESLIGVAQGSLIVSGVTALLYDIHRDGKPKVGQWIDLKADGLVGQAVEEVPEKASTGRPLKKAVTSKCKLCKKPFMHKLPAKYCSPRCRMRAMRGKQIRMIP